MAFIAGGEAEKDVISYRKGTVLDRGTNGEDGACAFVAWDGGVGYFWEGAVAEEEVLELLISTCEQWGDRGRGVTVWHRPEYFISTRSSFGRRFCMRTGDMVKGEPGDGTRRAVVSMGKVGPVFIMKILGG